MQKAFWGSAIGVLVSTVAIGQVVRVPAHRPYNDPYSSYYGGGKRITFTGKITGIQSVRVPDSTDSEVTLLVRNRDGGGTAVVELGPQWYVDNQIAKLRIKDTVQVSGSKVLVNGRGIILASNIVLRGQGGPVLALRRPTGLPYWTGIQEVSNPIVPTGGNVVVGDITGFTNYMVNDVPYAAAVLRTGTGSVTVDLGPQWYWGRQNIVYSVGQNVSVVVGPNPIRVGGGVTVLPTYGVYAGNTVYTVRYGNGQPAYYWTQP